MIMGCALFLFIGHGSCLSLQVDNVMPAVFEPPPSRHQGVLMFDFTTLRF
jgi:hypothetical protein